MRAIFCDAATIARYVEVEVALAAAEASVGVIPKDAAATIKRLARADAIDVAKLKAETDLVGYPIVGARAPARQAVRRGRPLRALGRHHPGHHGHRHRPADARRAGARRRRPRRARRGASPRSPASTATRVMAGRTHLQHALPVTFGYKAAVWLGMIARHRQRLAELQPARAGRPVRRRGRHAGLARRQGPRRARRADGRAGARRGRRRPGTSPATASRRPCRCWRWSPARSPRSPPT